MPIADQPLLRSFPRRWRNSSIVRPLLSSSAWSLLEQSIWKLAVLVATVFAARVLRVADFGFFVAMQALVLLSVTIWDLGFAPMLTREVSAGASFPLILRRAVRVKSSLLPLWALGYFLGAWALGGRTQPRIMATVLVGIGGLATALSLLLDGGLRANLRFRECAWATSAGRLLTAAVTVVTALARPAQPLVFLGAGFLLGEWVILAMNWMFTASIRRGPSGCNSATAEPWGTLGTLRRSAPYAMNGVLRLAYNRMDVILVTALTGATQAGLYAPASRIQDAMALLPAVAVAGVVPVAARAHSLRGNPAGTRRALRVSIALSIGLALPGAILAFLLLPLLIPALLGAGFTQAVLPARILVWSIPLAAIEAPLLAILIARGRAPATTLVYAVTLVSSIAAHVLLDPHFGAVGGAWASLIREPITLWVLIAVFRADGGALGLRQEKITA
jgi:O-antigen/teichoic acid export membrane protein